MSVYVHKVNILVNLSYESMLKIQMNKAPKHVTKDPIRQERGKKLHEMYMERLKKYTKGFGSSMISTSRSRDSNSMTSVLLLLSQS